MLRIFALLIMSIICLKLTAQQAKKEQPLLFNNFMILISAESTYESIVQTQAALNQRDFNLAFENLEFDKNRLVVFEVTMDFDCPNKPRQYHNSKILLNDGVPYPLHAIFIGEDCSHGTFSTNEEELKKLIPLLFPVNGPSFLRRVQP